MLGESQEYFGPIAEALTHPVDAIKAMAQETSDTYETEGLVYTGAYVIADVMIGKAVTSGISKATGTGAGAVDEIGDVANKADDVADVAETAGKNGVRTIVKTQKDIEIPALPEGSQWERNVLNSFAGGKSNPVTYKGGTTLYRIGGKNGGFWSLDPPPVTEYQWRVDFAIKQEFCNDASTVYKITVPEGSTLSGLEGKVGTQGMGLYGGAHQVYIDYRAIPEDWIEISPTTWK